MTKELYHFLGKLAPFRAQDVPTASLTNIPAFVVVGEVEADLFAFITDPGPIGNAVGNVIANELDDSTPDDRNYCRLQLHDELGGHSRRLNP